MPRMSWLASTPAAMQFEASLKKRLARTVAVVVPSPASSLVLFAASLHELDAHVLELARGRFPPRRSTPSLVTVGLPQDLSRIVQTAGRECSFDRSLFSTPASRARRVSHQTRVFDGPCEDLRVTGRCAGSLFGRCSNGADLGGAARHPRKPTRSAVVFASPRHACAGGNRSSPCRLRPASRIWRAGAGDGASNCCQRSTPPPCTASLAVARATPVPWSARRRACWDARSPARRYDGCR